MQTPNLLQANREVLPKPKRGYVLQKGFTVNIIAANDSAAPQLASPLATPQGSRASSPMRPSMGALSPLSSPRPRLVHSFMSRSADQLPGLPLLSSPRGRFEVRDFALGYMPFDPNLPALRGQLLQALQAPPTSRFQGLEGFQGGMNDGIWFLKTGSETLVLKLVKYDRFAPPQLVEERIFAKLYQEIPHIAEDPHVAFPSKVFRLLGPNNVRRHDLIVMRKAPGKSLDHLISEKWRSNRKGELWQIFKKVGETLAEFHRRYAGRQHNDAGTQNILYDEETHHVTLIDLGGMGNKTDKTDVQRLSQLVKKLSRCPSYGPELAVAAEYFMEGYKGYNQVLYTESL